VQAVGDEELEVPPGFLALAVHVSDERAVAGLGRCALGDGDC
jgi:hypothetical protein